MIADRASARASGMSGLLLGAAGMFATMYASHAILPELAADFDVTPSQAGLTISVVVLAVAVGGWFWGPLSERVGRKRSLMLASGLLVLPSLGAAVAPSFGALLVFRALQGACMPGLLTVGVPYVAEVFAPGMGGRAMGYYTIALVGGGTLGRVGVGLMTSVTGWRIAFAAVALLPLAGVVLMRRRLPEAPVPERSGGSRSAVATQLANAGVLVPAIAAAALFFTFVGIFSYTSFRLREAPFNFSPAATSLVFGLWVLGTIGPAAGRLADRVGWRRVALTGITAAACGVALTLPSWPPTVLLGLAVTTLGMFAGVTAAQLGLAAAGPRERDLLLRLLRRGRARRVRPRAGLGGVGLAGCRGHHRTRARDRRSGPSLGAVRKVNATS
jgi:YNFM family putative membrane transporter